MLTFTEMAGLKEECYLKVASKILDEEPVISLMSEVPAEICVLLPKTIVTKFAKEKIMLPTTTPTVAAYLVKEVS